MTGTDPAEPDIAPVPDASGHFSVAGIAYGGRFAPEALMAALDELAVADPAAPPHERLVKVGAAAAPQAREASPREDHDQPEERDASHSSSSSERAGDMTPGV